MTSVRPVIAALDPARAIHRLAEPAAREARDGHVRLARAG